MTNRLALLLTSLLLATLLGCTEPEEGQTPPPSFYLPEIDSGSARFSADDVVERYAIGSPLRLTELSGDAEVQIRDVHIASDRATIAYDRAGEIQWIEAVGNVEMQRTGDSVLQVTGERMRVDVVGGSRVILGDGVWRNKPRPE